MARVYINTVCFKALLLQLCAFSVLGQDLHVIPESNDTAVDGLIDEYYFDYTTDTPAEDFDLSLDDWLYELMDVADECDPNPCLNGGSCDHAADGSFKCLCPEPYSGKKCQIVTNVCKNVKCGRGSCVVTSTAPFNECKCKHPYKPPNCTKASRCRPNPCQNGGSCMKGPKHSSFQCSCPRGYTGKFCEVEPNDCYQEDGEFYRGMVSVTVEGEECLDWNSYFILQKGGGRSHQRVFRLRWNWTTQLLQVRSCLV
ncbi:hyaluronan-binding protein 2-like [Anarrhichthys ocellatus]|uniref:hyaluronan-binding protein 2-like n=1 Tax=Anarrhichthys ocellatus TaxID=433405 RepID=UPI0012ED98C9|nr:hyaluronan-binding protein 2-like [Anarrhichthys ocellatus]